jgi:hypothetical protein
MNKLASLSLIAAAALSLAPKPAQAGDKEAALIGGFIGGLIVGAVVADNSHHNVSYGPAPVVYQPAPVVCAPAPVVVDSCNTGYWSNVNVQVYVPGCWAFRYDCGRQVRYYVTAHYETRTNRVWVANNSHYDSHHGREVSSGYGRSHDSRGRDDYRRN